VTAGDHSSKNLSSVPLPIALLWQRGWPNAAGLFWSHIKEIGDVPRNEVAEDFWSGEKERCKVACRTLADLLFAAGHGEAALSALMLATDPTEPWTFEIVVPQLAFAIEHLWEWPTARVTRHDVLQRLSVRWQAARGDLADNDRSIFWIARTETLDQDDPSEGLPPRAQQEGGRAGEPAKPGVVVMPKSKSTKLNSYHSEFTSLVDAELPLRLARDIGAVRAKLMIEYPHAIGAIDLLLRDLREGQPVRLSPIVLTGPVGAGKTRLVRRLFTDLLGIGVYRYDGGGLVDDRIACRSFPPWKLCASGCFRAVSRPARRPASLKTCIAAAHERDEFNAQTCLTASAVIRQPHCPKLISLLIVFRIRERNTY
jgi:ATP-dependent Lon protease